MLRIQIRREKKALNAGHAFNRLQISEFSLFALLRVQAGRLWSFQHKLTEENQDCKLFPGDFNHPAQSGLLCGAAGKGEAAQPPSSPPTIPEFLWLPGSLLAGMSAKTRHPFPSRPGYSLLLIHLSIPKPCLTIKLLTLLIVLHSTKMREKDSNSEHSTLWDRPWAFLPSHHTLITAPPCPQHSSGFSAREEAELL